MRVRYLHLLLPGKDIGSLWRTTIPRALQKAQTREVLKTSRRGGGSSLAGHSLGGSSA